MTDNNGDAAAPMARDAAAQGLAVTLGLAVGGPVGALLAALATPVFQVLARRGQRSLDNAARLIELASAETGRNEDEIASWAQSSDERLVFTASAVQAALRTLNEQKVDALARLLARNLKDDARLDADTVMATVLADLEAAHIRILHAWVHEEPPPRSQSLSQLRARWPQYGNMMEPLVATLERHRLVTEGLAAGEDDPAWRCTEFGYECLRFLEDRPITPGVLADS